MPAYLVRLIDNRDIVGVFAADSRIELAMAVDECTDTSDCEYVELPVGGLIWTSPASAVPIKLSDMEGDDDTAGIPKLPWDRIELSESWWSVIYGYTDEKWTKFHPKGKAPPPSPPTAAELGQVIPMRRRRG